MDFEIEVDREITELTPQLANSIWQYLVYAAPYDTGNLRTAIKRHTSNPKRITFIYDTAQAYYLDFLERGVGPVKKYKGFIEDKSVGWAVKEIIEWAKTGNTLFGGSVPSISLRGRTHIKGKPIPNGGQPFGYEKQLLNDKTTPLTARERGQLSRLYFKIQRPYDNPRQFSGEKINATRGKGVQRSRIPTIKGLE